METFGNLSPQNKLRTPLRLKGTHCAFAGQSSNPATAKNTCGGVDGSSPSESFRRKSHGFRTLAESEAWLRPSGFRPYSVHSALRDSVGSEQASYRFAGPLCADGPRDDPFLA
jgi:hypothetical protein